VAFKHNLPIPAVALVLIVAAITALVIFLQPPEEDQIRQAVDRYVATIGPVKQIEIHGTVADIIAGEQNTLIYAEFEKRDGTWTFARNLADEFTRAMKEPEIQKAILTHLGEKVSQRFQTSVSFKQEALDFRYELLRDRELNKLIGKCSVQFAYPKVGDQQRRGQYAENFEWKDGKWQSWGPGALFDKVVGP
jgi:hypothetical protein